ncbi:MAG TPA: FKBP-type peptidyl-prolyl cis-trans isomerase [Candidatus Saccharimonadales bacterium]|nr:FKBP-type peptidyl-prolyl cis-trans isomerase [Candidatus Saccharimonadales bacterium]
MATPKSQRIGIWIIAIVMLVGTIGSFAVMILGTNNNSADQANIKQLTDAYQKDYTAYQAKVNDQATQLSAKYFTEFNQYATQPAVFDRDSVKTLTTTDLKVGDGDVLGKDATFTAYYLGWTPNGKVFDGSIDGTKLKAPFTASAGGVIAGWTKGVEGMKIGGVRELTIPSEDAYGEKGNGDSIPPNTPLKFIIMVIPTPETIPQPEMPQALLDYYSKNAS